MALTLPPSFQQLKDLPLRIECEPALKAEVLQLFTQAATQDATGTHAFYLQADAVVTQLVTYLDAQIAHTTQQRFQAGDANSLKQKLLADPRRMVDQTLSTMKQRVSNDRSDWTRRLTKQLKDIQDSLAHELTAIPVAERPDGNMMLVVPEPTWRMQFSRWADGAIVKWATHLGSLLQDRTSELLRGDLDVLGQQVSAKLLPTLPKATVPVLSPQVPERAWEARFEPPGLMGTIFDTFKNGLNTVAMLAGMIVIPVIGSLMNESPVHVRAIVMSATIMPVIFFAGFQGVRSRRRLTAQLLEKARNEIAKNVDTAMRAQMDRFKLDAERYCADYGQQALSTVLHHVEPFVAEHFAARESAATGELAAAQIQLDRLQDQVTTLRSVRTSLVSQVQVDVRRRLSEG
jgi:hypothetical protein